MSVKCAGACNLQRAARLRRDQADLYEAARNSTAAIDALEQAMELFEADGGSISAAACRLRIADLRAMRGDLVVARQLFEELVAEAFNAPTKAAGGMPCYLLRFRVGLCYLADGRPEQLEAALEKYAEEDLSFQDSEVYTRLRDFMEALLNSDVDAFNKIVRGMGDSAGTDKVVTSLLLTTKRAVTRQSEAGERVAQSLAAQDDDDLL
jgi:tetratricopeptide (TPR) repeat protein